MVWCLFAPEPGQDQMPIQENKSCLSEDGKHTRLQVKKWISNAGSVAYSLRIGDDKILPVLSLKTPMRNFNGRRGTQIEFVLLLLVKFSTKQRFLLKTCYLKEEWFKIMMNALNVGRIKLAAACLDAQQSDY
jgi:hypothetical protein